MTFTAALEILRNTNNEAAAWEVAKQDKGLSPDVTMEVWVAFARRAIERAAQSDASQRAAAQY